jgi:hypothetical protein
LVGNPDFKECDIAIRWDINEIIVGLFICKTLWAAFDARNCAKYGGNYHPNSKSDIPLKISTVFEPI